MAAIIVSIAGNVAKRLMVWWDRALKRRQSHNHVLINMYSRYVDYINIVVNTPTEEGTDEIGIKTNTIENIQKIEDSILQSFKVSNYYTENTPLIEYQY